MTEPLLSQKSSRYVKPKFQLRIEEMVKLSDIIDREEMLEKNHDRVNHETFRGEFA